MKIILLSILVCLPVFAAPEWDWYTIDTHIHVNGCKNTNYSAAEILRQMKEENINLGSILVWGGTNGTLRSQDLDVQYFQGQQDDSISEANWKIRWDVELSQLAGEWHGHLVFLNVKKGIFGSEPYDVNYPGQDYLLSNFDYIQEMGGVAGFQHFMFWANAWDTPTVNLPVAREMPLDITMKKIDFISSEFIDKNTLWFWYGMLQAGFQIPLFGDSDFGCIHDKIGAYHVAFPISAGDSLSYSKFVEAAKKGRVVARKNNSTPDHLNIRADSALMGDTLFLAEEGDTITVEVDASSIDAGKKVELVMNGSVIKTQSITSTIKTYSWDVVVEKSSWLAARIPLSSDGKHQAHTATIFVLAGGCPIRNDPTGARNWKSYLDKYYAYSVAQNANGNSSDSLEYYKERAKLIWEDIALEAEGKKTMKCIEPVSIKRKRNGNNPNIDVTEFSITHEGMLKLGPDGQDVMGLSIYDIHGTRVVKVKGNQWDGQDSKGTKLAEGVYFARLQFRDKQVMIKFSLMR
ncbi:MAG: CehA/McbA family metallohydrolase [Fibrobacteria bacterium]|nr:CehA/McbA family metallohydrolase [Fibrobacteria bacterium]